MKTIPENDKFHVGRYGTIAEALESSLWFHKFVAGLCDFYGYPPSNAACATKRDRLLYAWAMMNIVQSITEYSVLWINGIDRYDIDLLVESFARGVYELSGEDVIPPFIGGSLIK